MREVSERSAATTTRKGRCFGKGIDARRYGGLTTNSRRTGLCGEAMSIAFLGDLILQKARADHRSARHRRVEPIDRQDHNHTDDQI